MSSDYGDLFHLRVAFGYLRYFILIKVTVLLVPDLQYLPTQQ
jgi:hypothetical protein